MIDPSKINEIEQAMTSVGEVSIPFYWKVYSCCLNEGFSKEQAMEIVKYHIQNPTGKVD